MQTNEWHNIFVYSYVGSYKKKKPVACLYTVVIKTPYKHAEVIEPNQVWLPALTIVMH